MWSPKIYRVVSLFSPRKMSFDCSSKRAVVPRAPKGSGKTRRDEIGATLEKDEEGITGSHLASGNCNCAISNSKSAMRLLRCPMFSASTNSKEVKGTVSVPYHCSGESFVRAPGFAKVEYSAWRQQRWYWGIKEAFLRGSP